MKKIKKYFKVSLVLIILMTLIWPIKPVYAEENVEINKTNFPDDNFRQYVSDNFDKSDPKDNILSQAESERVKQINVTNKGITNLKGVEHFTKLRDLFCGYNQIKELDVSKNTLLENLNCDENNLTSLDLSNTKLDSGTFFGDLQKYTIHVDKNTKYYDFSSMPGSFDLANAINRNKELVDGKLNLTEEEIDVFTYDYKTGKEGKTLGVSLTIQKEISNEDVKLAFIANNGTTTEDWLFVDKNNPYVLPEPPSNFTPPAGKVFYAWDVNGDEKKVGDPITLSANTTLWALWREKPVVKINEENFPNDNFRQHVSDNCDTTPKDGSLSQEELNEIKSLDVSGKSISNLKGIEHFTNLNSLVCENNSLDSLDLSSNLKLTSLNCNENPNMTSLNIKNNRALERLYCMNAGLSSLDLSGNPALNLLVVPNNKLSELNLDRNTLLETLNCDDNKLTSIDLSRMNNLETLKCSNNHLTSLDVPSNAPLNTFEGSGQTYAIKVNENTLKFDLTLLPQGFNVAKAGDWVGGSVSGNILTTNSNTTSPVKYKYNAGQSKSLEVALNITYSNAPRTISFNGNGGSGTMATKTIEAGSNYTLPANAFTAPAGKVFDAWDVGGERKAVGDSITVNNNITIKALWKDANGNPIQPQNPNYLWPIYQFILFGPDTSSDKTETKAEPVEILYETVLDIGNKTIQSSLNGVNRSIEMDVAPYLSNGRTMLPIRFIAEALGFEVDWIKDTNTVIIKDKKNTIEIPLDTNKIIVNGKTYESDVKPELVSNRTMVPIANVARALGLKDGQDIIWNPKTQQVTIKRSLEIK
ncbi:MAG: stalk domain-containing protein [Bacillota bacterium]|nr:stalk domain-containing protein [Bacillota bacterium]